MKNIIIGFILGGIIFGTIGVVASTLISSKNVRYQNKTVNTALDELYNEAVTGKELVAAAITNKGVTTTSSDTYEVIANNINNIKVNNNLEFKIRTQGYASYMYFDVSNYHYMKVENSSTVTFYYVKNTEPVPPMSWTDSITNTTKIVDISEYETIGLALNGPGGSKLDAFVIVSFYN